MTHWNRKSVCIGGAAVALAFMLTGSVGASVNPHKNNVTFSRPVALPHGIVLPVGTYAFDIESDISLDVVVVRNRTGQKMLYRGLTNPTTRPLGMSSDTSIVMGEAPGNQAAPIKTWYELGSQSGHEFKY